VFLDALPLNASGKVNRKALPAPQPMPAAAGGTSSGQVFDEPKEKALATVWTEVLGRAPADADAHYFNSGGDSIKAIQMTARLRTQGYRLTLREVFARPRFADLAAALVVVETVDKDAEVVTGEIPLTPIQHWFLETFPPPYDHFNQATLLESDQRLRPDLLRQALDQGRWGQLNVDREGWYTDSFIVAEKAAGTISAANFTGHPCRTCEPVSMVFRHVPTTVAPTEAYMTLLHDVIINIGASGVDVLE
jgi:aryl carrier-like protein